MPWFAVYETETGRLRSLTTFVPSPLPDGLASKALSKGDDGTVLWDAVLRDWSARPPAVVVDRLQDLVNHAYVSDVWANMTAARRQKLRRLIVWLLAGRRYRRPGEEVSVDPPEGWPTDPSVVVE